MTIFNKIADSYDSWYNTPMGEFVDAVETGLAFKMFKVRKGMKILDVGCGTGNFSIKLADMGCRVTGVDISVNMLDIARKKAEKGGYNIDFYNMDAYSLDFADEEFDGVFSMAAFEFITQPEKALDELLRVVKKGGQVLVGTISRDSSWGELYLTEEYQKNTVFKYADFKTLEEMKSWRAQNLVDAGECLFVPPTSVETDFNMQKEQELAGKVKGGYICAVWKK
jgi:ubiquinone/menaquinone biosynthesis C-methylase UbiE